MVHLVFATRPSIVDRLRVGRLNGSGRGSVRAEDAQGTPTQSHISPSIFLYTKIMRRLARLIRL